MAMEGLELFSKKRKLRLPEKEKESDKKSGGFELEKPKRKLRARKEFVLKGRIVDKGSEVELKELGKELKREALQRRAEGLLHQKMHNNDQPRLWIQFSKDNKGEFIIYAGDGDGEAHMDGDPVDWNDLEGIEKTLVDFTVSEEEWKSREEKLAQAKDKVESGEKNELNGDQEKFLGELKNKTEAAALKELERIEKKSKSENAAEKQARKILREISELVRINEDEINNVFNSGLHKKFLEKKSLTKGDISEINEKMSKLSGESDFLLEIKDEYGEHKKEVGAENERLKRVIERRRTWLQEILEKYNQQIEKTAIKKSNVAAKKPITIKQEGLDELEGRSRIASPANNGSANDEIEEFAQGVIENEKRREELKKENDNEAVDISVSSESKSEDIEIKTSRQEDGGRKIKIEVGDAEDSEKAEDLANKKELPREEQADLFSVSSKNKEGLEQLKKEVEEARKEYAAMDYKKNKAYKRIYKFLFNWSEDKNHIEDQDIAYHRAHYDSKLFNYKNALIEDAKARVVSNEELGEIVRLFEFEGRLNMADAHTQVKFENQDGRLLGFVKNHGKDMVGWYNSLSLKKKIAIGAVFGLVSAGSVFAGAAAAGAVASAATIRRVFAGVVTGTTLSLALESRDRKKAEKNVEESVKSFVEQLGELTAEERARLVEDKIKELVFRGDDELQKIKNKNLFHLSAGALAGSVVGSGVLSDVIGKGYHRVVEYFGFAPEISTSGGAGKTVEMAKSHGAGYAGQGNVDSLKEMTKAEIASEDVIPETKAEDLAAPRSAGISDSDFIKDDQFPRNLSPEELSSVENDVPENMREVATNDAVSEAVEESSHSDLVGKFDEIMADVDGRSGVSFEKWSMAADAADAHEFLIQKHDLDFAKGFMEDFKKAVLSGDKESSAKAIQKIISTGNDWEEISGMRFTGATVKELGWRSNERVREALENLNKIFGNEIKPDAQETLESWTKRVAAVAMEKAGK